MRGLTALILFSLLSITVWAKPQQAAIASAHPLATQAGIEILQQGGNAFDAAVAITAALAVVEPAGSGLGGGGFWLLHRASDNFRVMVDGREMAPGKAHADMFLDEQGEFVPERSLNGPLAAGIPGVPAALVHLNQHYGQLPLSASLQPAIRYAEEGFAVSEGFRRLARFRQDVMRTYPSTAAIFLHEGDVPEPGHRIIQAELANTLKALAQEGQPGFYQGAIAEKLVEAVQKNGGIWTMADLASYEVKEREPLSGEYRGYQITSSALPSSGGTVLMLALNQLSGFDLTRATQDQQRHWVIEVMRRAYRDRARYLGDADFVTIPDYLTSIAYAEHIRADIDDQLATPSQDLPSRDATGENTTHFSVIDSAGNHVAATLSINYPFGSGFVAEGTGVLLNDEMDDFSAQLGKANAYGLIGNSANAIAPFKRPMSSMSPTFIENDDSLMITGTPGGSRIISMVLLSILDFVAGKTAREIVTTPRYHHQFSPDEVQIESTGFSADDILALRERGHHIHQLNRRYGDMQTIIVDKRTGVVDVASDPRGEGLAAIVEIRP